MSQIIDEILDIVAQKAMIDRAKLNADAKLADLQISSLDVVEIVFALEDKFQIQIPFNANSTSMEFTTVGEVIGVVEKLIQAKKDGKILTEADLFPKKEPTTPPTGDGSNG
jgi:acyl carrier protein